MEEFSHSEEPENDMYLTTLWIDTWRSTMLALDNHRCMTEHWNRFHKWERDVERERWDGRAKVARDTLFYAHFSENYKRLPEWMTKRPSFRRSLDFMWYQ
jgi:hypothetical protein